MAKTDDTYQPILSEPGGPVNAPVYNPGPSSVGILADTFSSFITQFKNDREERTRQRALAAKQKQEDDDNKASWELWNQLNAKENSRVQVSSPSQVVEAEDDTGPTIDPNLPLEKQILGTAVTSGEVTQTQLDSISQETQSAAKQIGNLSIAEQQGTMTSLATKARISDIILQVHQKFPSVPLKVLAAALKDSGIETSMFPEMQAEFAMVTDTAKAKREERTKKIALGQSVTPPGVVRSDAELEILGHDLSEAERRFEAEKARLEMAKTQGDINQQQHKFQEEQLEKDAATVLEQQMIAALAPTINQWGKIFASLPEPGINPATEIELAKTKELLQTQIPIVMNSISSRFLGRLPLEQRQKILDSVTKFFTDSILTPIESRDKSVGQIYETLTKKLEINAHTAFSLISTLKAAGLDLSVDQLVLESIADNKVFKEQFKREINQLSSGASGLGNKNTAIVWYNNVMAVLRGQTTLNGLNLTQNQLNAHFSTVRNVGGAAASQVIKGTASEATTDAFRNSQMELVAKGSDVSPGASPNTHANVIMSLAGFNKTQNTVNTRVALDKLIKAGDQEALVAGLGSRATIGQSYYSLRSSKIANTTYGGYRIRYNARLGRFEIPKVTNGPRNMTVQEPSTGKIVTVDLGIATSPPKELSNIARALNTGLDFLVKSSEWDPSSPQGKEGELRNFYGANMLTTSMKKEVKEKKTKEGQENKTLKALEAFNQNLRENLGNINLEAPTIPGESGLEIDENGKAVIPSEGIKMSSALSKKGYTPQVIAGVLANVHHESAFNPGRPGDSGSAHGYFQHRLERAENFQRVTGVHPSQATPEQAIAFFDWEMKNPEQAGMTEDEVAEIKAAKTPEEAAWLIQQHYERPKVNDPQRKSTARSIYSSLYAR